MRGSRIGVLAAVCAAFSLAIVLPAARPAPRTAPQAPAPLANDPKLIEDLVYANRILYQQEVLDGFGHVSVRSDKDPGHFLMSRSMAPALVTSNDIMEFDRDGEPVDAHGRNSYVERYIHAAIYRVRPDVKACAKKFGVSRIAVYQWATDRTIDLIMNLSCFRSSGAKRKAA